MNRPGPIRQVAVSVLFLCQWLAAWAQPAALTWKQLPPLPDKLGFAGSFAGISGGALIVAGGANFPEAMPWAGGPKVWHDSIFVLPQPDGDWRIGFKLPRPLGYGVSVTTPDGVLCAGGSDSREHSRDVFLLCWRKDGVELEALPPLPHPLANACGARLGTTVYLAGGIATPNATNALRNFWALDLAANPRAWRALESWPGPARMFAVAGVGDGSFFLFSGAELSSDATGRPVRRYLDDAYRFSPAKGWKRIADLPRPAGAAPSPAITRRHQLLIVSGDDGKLVNFEPKSAHPGFPKSVLAYDLKTDSWIRLGESPVSRATVPEVEWQGCSIIPSGETRPGVRTPEVWGLKRR